MLPTIVRRTFKPVWQARVYGVLLAAAPVMLLGGLLGLTTIEPTNVETTTDERVDQASGADAVTGQGDTASGGFAADGSPLDPSADGVTSSTDSGPGLSSDGGASTITGLSGGSSGTGTAGAGGTSGSGGATSTTIPGSSTKVVLRATDQGVTKDEIKIGYLIPNTGELAALGFNVGVQSDNRKIGDAWANFVNKRGGILGRKVRVVYDTFSVLDVNDMLRACTKMADDEKVFSVINLGGYDSIAQLCLAKDKKIPFFAGDPQPADWYQQSAPYLWTTLMSKDRMHRNQVRLLKENGTLTKGADIGVIYHGIPNVAPTVEKAMLPEFERQGVKPVKVIRLVEDSNQALNQIPQAVLDMQRAGVKQVFLMMNLIYKTQFIQQAEKQAYRVAYFDNDHYFGCYDFTTGTYPDSYDGATCVTATNSGVSGPQNFFNPKLNQSYVKFAESVYKESFPAGYADGGGDSEDGQNAQAAGNLSYGTYFLMWKEAAERTGADLTRARWGVEMAKTTSWDRTVTSPGFSFGPKKFDGPDSIAILRWTAAEGNGYEAKKFRQVAGFRPAFY